MTAVASSQVLLVGCGGHARFVLSMVKACGFEVAGLIDTRVDFDPTEKIMGIPVIADDSQLPHLRDRFDKVVMAIGGNTERRELFDKIVSYGFSMPNICHPSAFIDDTAVFGKGNVVGPNAVVGAEVEVGDNNIINSAAVIEHQSIIGDHNHIAPSATLCGVVGVGNKVLVGANSTVIPKVKIADDIVLGAGSTLINSVTKAGITLVGNPARELTK